MLCFVDLLPRKQKASMVVIANVDVDSKAVGCLVRCNRHLVKACFTRSNNMRSGEEVRSRTSTQLGDLAITFSLLPFRIARVRSQKSNSTITGTAVTAWMLGFWWLLPPPLVSVTDPRMGIMGR